MPELAQFHDRPHFEKLAGYLWAEKGPGAAVMVGAGFSRNAEPVVGTSMAFPTWDDLGLRLMGELDRGTDDGGAVPSRVSERQHAALGGIDTIRLASEYEAAFGTTALEELLRRAIPDDGFEPGTVHGLLLELPWQDVFTTNYDTLLERTRPRVIDRKYDTVYTPNDIAAAEAPRIVKLHGSFPSFRPWIVTDEHYRRYPMDFAPFVNMVQQSMMENALCLIGFSGDDQNFLYWTGWVRDVLGAARLPVYLLALDVSSTRRAWLERHNVTPIDLGPLFPMGSESNNRHRTAMEWALHSLHANRTPDPNRWPKTTVAMKPYVRGFKTPPLAVARRRNGTPATSPRQRTLSRDETLSQDELRIIRDHWKRQRVSYPGWLIAPSTARTALKMEIESHADNVVKSLGQTVAPDDILTLRELNWLLETTLTPLHADWVHATKKVLESYNPFPRVLPLRDAEHMPAGDMEAGLDWNRVGTAWIELAFSVLRKARETNDSSGFEEWSDRIQSLLEIRQDWKRQWLYEKALHAMMSSDQQTLLEILAEWPSSQSDGAWVLRHAKLLIEADRTDEAHGLLQESLTNIRRRITSDPNSRRLLSEEGWTMFILDVLQHSETAFSSSVESEQYRERWAYLERYRCNPWTEFEHFRSLLKKEPPSPGQGERHTPSYDPGRVKVSHTWGSGFWSEIEEALRFLRLVDDVGLPRKIGFMDVAGQLMARAAFWIQPYEPSRALPVLLRSGSKEDMERFFTRVRVATLPDDQVNFTFEFVTSQVEVLTEGLDKGATFSDDPVSRLSSHLEVLSRIALRLDEMSRANSLTLAIELSHTPWVQRNLSVYRVLRNMFERVLYAMSEADVLQMLGPLLNVPIPGETDVRVQFPDHWPEPFHYVRFEHQKGVSKLVDTSEFEDRIRTLVNLAGEPGTARDRALYRLQVLNKAELLTSEQHSAFVEALWRVVDEETELPLLGDYTAWGMLSLPAPAGDRLQEKVGRKLLRMQPILIIRVAETDGKKRFSSSRPLMLYENEILSVTRSVAREGTARHQQMIDWTEEEAIALFGKMRQSWNAQKDGVHWYLEKPFSPGDQKDFWPMVGVLARVILPRTKADTQRQVVALLDEMNNYGIDIAAARPFVLLPYPDRFREATSRLRDNLLSYDKDAILAGAIGLYNWGVFSANASLPPVPASLIDLLVHHVTLRRHPGLDTALDVSAGLIRHAPGLFETTHFTNLVTALQRLQDETSLGAVAPQTGSADRIESEELPRLRLLATRLARALYDSPDLVAMDEDILKRWKQIGETDVLPEVRYEWAAGGVRSS